MQHQQKKLIGTKPLLYEPTFGKEYEYEEMKEGSSKKIQENIYNS